MGLISLELGTEYFCSLIPAVVTHPTPQTQQHAVNFYSYFTLVSLIKQIAFTDQKGYWGRGGKNVGLASLPRPEPFRGAPHSRKTTLLPGFGTETDRLLLAQLLNNWVGGYRVKGFPSSSVVKEPACNSGDVGLLPGSGRSPGEGSGNSLQYYCQENPVDRGAWWAIRSQRVRHGWTTEHTHTHTHTQTHTPHTHTQSTVFFKGKCIYLIL